MTKARGSVTLNIHPYGHRNMSSEEIESILTGLSQYAADVTRWTLDGAWLSHDSGLRCRVYDIKYSNRERGTIEIGLNDSDTFTFKGVEFDFSPFTNLMDDLKFKELKPTIDQIIVLTALNQK